MKLIDPPDSERPSVRQKSEAATQPLAPVEPAPGQPASCPGVPGSERRLPIRRSILIIVALSLLGWGVVIGTISLFL